MPRRPGLRGPGAPAAGPVGRMAMIVGRWCADTPSCSRSAAPRAPAPRRARRGPGRGGLRPVGRREPRCLPGGRPARPPRRRHTARRDRRVLRRVAQRDLPRRRPDGGPGGVAGLGVAGPHRRLDLRHLAAPPAGQRRPPPGPRPRQPRPARPDPPTGARHRPRPVPGARAGGDHRPGRRQAGVVQHRGGGPRRCGAGCRGLRSPSGGPGSPRRRPGPRRPWARSAPRPRRR